MAYEVRLYILLGKLSHIVRNQYSHPCLRKDIRIPLRLLETKYIYEGIFENMPNIHNNQFCCL